MSMARVFTKADPASRAIRIPQAKTPWATPSLVQCERAKLSGAFVRIGTRPVITLGAFLASAGVFWLSRIPLHGSYPTNLLAPLVIMAFGLGFVFVGVTTAANEGVPPDKAGLAAALINSSTWIGGALGLAIFSAIATSRTNHLLARHVANPAALTSGFQRALLVCSIFLFAAALIALRATNT